MWPDIALEPTVVRDMEKAETAVSRSYTTPATIRAYVEGLLDHPLSGINLQAGCQELR